MRTRLAAAALLAASLGTAVPVQAAHHRPAAGQKALPPGVTRMSARDRLTQCHEMMVPILDQIEKRERPRSAVASPYTRDDRQADEIALAELQDCHDLLGDLIARLQRTTPAPPRRR
jgi:hypothetical protein